MTTREDAGTLPDGRTVEAYTLRNANGVAVRILTLGGTMQSVPAPDRHGTLTNITLGWPDAETYLTARGHLGSLIGRYANRLAGGRFAIDGVTYQVVRNNGDDTLHGGAVGFHKAVWKVTDAGARHLALSHNSPDGDQGFPGNLAVRAIYSLSDENVLEIAYEAETDAPTVINLTNHAYWNLAGHGDILDHRLQVNAERFTPVNARMMPTGELAPVAGTPFDFRRPTILRRPVMQTDNPQIAQAGGVDHNFVVTHAEPGDLTCAAILSEDSSGRVMEVWTTEPGIQVYTGNSLAGEPVGIDGAPYKRWNGIALETQHFPNSPSEPSFPATVLRPGETFRSRTQFRFRTQPR